MTVDAEGGELLGTYFVLLQFGRQGFVVFEYLEDATVGGAVQGKGIRGSSVGEGVDIIGIVGAKIGSVGTFSGSEALLLRSVKSHAVHVAVTGPLFGRLVIQLIAKTYCSVLL